VLGKRCRISSIPALRDRDRLLQLKSISKGYASFDYDFRVSRVSDMVKLDILLSGDPWTR
jgi:hypothetical protein